MSTHSRRFRPRLLGRLVPRRPAADPVHPVPRRGRRVRLRVDRARPVRLSAHRPRAAVRRARRAQPQAVGRHGVRAPAPGRTPGTAVWTQIEDVAKLTAAVGGKHVVVIPEMWRDPATGAVLEDRNLTAEQWRKKTDGHERARQGDVREVRRACAVPPARRQPRRHRGERLPLPRRHRRRVRQPVPGHRPHQLLRRRQHRDHPTGYPSASATCTSSRSTPRCAPKVEAEDLPFGEAVKLGAMIEPPLRHSGDAAAARGDREARHRRVRDRRAGHVPLRGRRSAAHRPAHPASTSGPAVSRPFDSTRSSKEHV